MWPKLFKIWLLLFARLLAMEPSAVLVVRLLALEPSAENMYDQDLGENWDLLAMLPSALPICAPWTSGENCGPAGSVALGHSQS